MLAEPSAETLKEIDWDGLESVRAKAEAARATMTEAVWRALFAEALSATRGNRGVAIDQLSLYGRPEWVPSPIRNPAA